MKKLFTLITLIGFGMGATGYLSAQSHTMDNGEVSGPSTPGGVDYLGSCDTLSTTFAGGNGSEGNMFTITTNQDIIIQSFDQHMQGSGTIRIYYKWGGYTGFEATPAAWTLIDSAIVNNVGANMPSPVPININLPVDSGQTVSFFVSVNGDGGAISYTNGTTEGAVYATDGTIDILEGIAVNFPWGTVNTPRVWNGIVHYCPNVNYCREITTTYAGGNGLDGSVFEVVALEDIIVQSFDVALDDTGYVQIWYKSGTYAGNLTNQGAWTLADSVLVETAGIGVPTEIPINLDLYIPQGQIYSFIITGSDYGPQDVDYTNGTAIGTPYINDNNIQIREGEGFNAPWIGGNGSPRVLNQTVHYCLPFQDNAIVCDDLFTTNAMGNQNDGIMFNIRTSNTAVEIQGFDAFFSAPGPVEARIYYKSGTYIGSETTPGDWTMIDSATVNVLAAGSLTNIPIPMQLQLVPNQTYGFYIITDGSAFTRYTNGNVIDTLFAMDPYIQVYEGQGSGTYFGTFTSGPRVFNGRVNYCWMQSFIGIEDENIENGLAIWPNPTTGFLNIELLNVDDEIQKVEIMDLNGKMIYSTGKPNANVLTVDISGNPNGIYMVRTFTNNTISTRKVILTN